MRAIRIHRFGGPDVLQLDDIDPPEAGEGQVLIKVAAASVNPVDYKMRRGGYPRLKAEDLPFTLGRDVAGVVQTPAGPFKEGDEVYAHLAWEDGGYADFARAAPGGVSLKPRTLSLIEAAAVPLAATTAWQGLFDHGGLEAGRRVLIQGASGGVGAFAVQFAKARGAYVFATASGDGVGQVKALGADQVIDHERERFEDTARDIDLVYDLVGHDIQTRSIAVLTPSGVLISSLEITGDTKAAAEAKGVEAKRHMAVPNAEDLAEIGRLIDDGEVKVTVVKTLPLDEAAKAHHMIEDEHPRGKIVLVT